MIPDTRKLYENQISISVKVEKQSKLFRIGIIRAEDRIMNILGHRESTRKDHETAN